MLTLEKYLPIKYWQFVPVALGLLAFGNSLFNGHALDDYLINLENKFVQQGVAGIYDLFTHPYAWGSGFNDALFRPLSVIMFAIEHELVGNSPMLGHFINLALYGGVCFLLYRFFADLLGSSYRTTALLAAVLFAIHPLHAEVVANIKSRDELLCLFFFLLCVKYGWDYLKEGKKKGLLLSLLMFLLAFLSKESTITFLAALPLVWYYKGEFTKKRITVIMSGLAAVSLAFLYYRHLVIYVWSPAPSDGLYTLLANTTFEAETKLDRLGMGAFLTLKYIGMYIVPNNLGHDYSFNQIPFIPLASAKATVSLLVNIALVILAYKGLKKKNYWAFSAAFFLITISIYTNIAFIIGVTFAERFAFVSSIAMSLAAAMAIVALSKKGTFGKMLSNVFLVLCLVGFTWKSIARSAVWKDNYTLFGNDVKTVKNSVKAKYNWGTALKDKARTATDSISKRNIQNDAEKWLNKAITQYPVYIDAYNNLGTLIIEKAEYNRAIPVFEKLLSMSPNFEKAHFNLGICYYQLKQYEKAIPYFKLYTTNKDDFPQAWFHIGMCYGNIGRFSEAIPALENAVRLNGNYWEAYSFLGKSYGFLQQGIKARNFFLKAYEIAPNNMDVVMDLAINHMIANEPHLAKPYAEKALELNSKHQPAVAMLNDIESR